MRKLNKETAQLLLTALLWTAACTTQADITISQTINVETGGVLGMLASDSTVEMKVSGDRSATATKLQPRSRMMRAMMGGETLDLIHLDSGQIFNVDMKRKRYSVMSIEEQRARMEESLQQIEQMQAESGSAGSSGSGDAGLPVSEEDCEWQPAEMTSEIGAGEAVAGIDTELATYKVKQQCVDKQSGKSCDFVWTMQQWLATDMPGAAEILAFHQRYAAAMGMEDFMAEARQPGMASLFSTFQQGWSDLAEQASVRQGYPLKSLMQVEVGGEQCTFESGEQVATSDIFGDAMQAGAESAGGYAAQSAANKAADGVGGGIAGAAARGIGRELAGGLMGRFRKKKEPEPETPAAAPGATGTGADAAGLVTMFIVTTTTNEVSTAPIAAGELEPPAGFKLVAAPKAAQPSEQN